MGLTSSIPSDIINYKIKQRKKEVNKMTREEMEVIVKELQEQDKIMNEIRERRKELAIMTKKANCYDEVWEMLYDDHQPHWEF